MSPLYSVPTNPGQMEWDIVSIEDDPMSISDSSDEESDISDEESNTSDEGSNLSDEGSVVDDAAENDLASVISEDPVEDDDLHEIQAQLEGRHRWSSGSDLAEDPSMEEDIGDVDNESVKDQAEVIEERDEMQDILDEQNRMQEILDEQNSFSSRSSKSDSANQRNQGRVIFGLDQQKTTRQKVSDWFDKN